MCSVSSLSDNWKERVQEDWGGGGEGRSVCDCSMFRAAVAWHLRCPDTPPGGVWAWGEVGLEVQMCQSQEWERSPWE